jgi:hypothetical protein
MLRHESARSVGYETGALDLPKDKQGDFRRLASKRTTATLEAIRKIENLSNRANYEFTEEQVERIFSTLRAAVSEAERKFKSGSARKREFVL